MSSINLQARTNLINFVTKARSKMQKVAKETLLEMGNRLIERSPVGDPKTWHPAYWPKGYVPGHFINNWQVGIDTIPVGVIPGSDPTGSGSRERLSHLGRWQLNHTYYFVNNVPYAKRLEEGWSSQCPPSGMIGLTRMEFQDIAKAANQKVIFGED